jgi:hypothetical protein
MYLWIFQGGSSFSHIKTGYSTTEFWIMQLLYIHNQPSSNDADETEKPVASAICVTFKGCAFSPREPFTFHVTSKSINSFSIHRWQRDTKSTCCSHNISSIADKSWRGIFFWSKYIVDVEASLSFESRWLYFESAVYQWLGSKLMTPIDF